MRHATRPSARRTPHRRHRLSAMLAAFTLALAALVAAPTVATAADWDDFENVGAPGYSGSGIVTTDLTAVLDLTDVTPTPTTVTFDWYLLRTDEHVGQGETLTLTDSLAGEFVYVTATLEAQGVNPLTTTSLGTVLVDYESFMFLEAPTITGNGMIGTELTADIDISSATPTPTSITYTWFIDDPHTVPTLLHEGKTLTVTEDLENKVIYVTATLRAPSAREKTSNESLPVVPWKPHFADVGKITIAGTGIVGTDLTAEFDTASISPTPTQVVYGWYDADAHKLVGEGITLPVTSDLVGSRVYVAAWLYNSAVKDRTVKSEASPVIRRSFSLGDAPTVSGDAVWLGELTAQFSTKGWDPVPTEVSWQWYRGDNTAITGETSSRLNITAGLIGHSVYAMATVTAKDTVTAQIATAPSAVIPAPVFVVDDATLGPGDTVTAGDSVSVNATGLGSDTDYRVELHSTPVLLGTVTSSSLGALSATVRIPADTEPGAHELVLLTASGIEMGTIPITVVAPESAALPTDRLPATGSTFDPLPGVAVGAVLLWGGLLLLRLPSPRRHTMATAD